MDKIFVLEDNEERIKWFKNMLKHEENTAIMEIADTTPKALELLSKTEYDMMFLDHDLGGEIFVDIGREDTGTYLAKCIVERGLQKNAEIILHSQNPIGAESMYNLFKVAGYNVIVLPFTQLYHEYKEHLKEYGTPG